MSGKRVKNGVLSNLFGKRVTYHGHIVRAGDAAGGRSSRRKTRVSATAKPREGEEGAVTKSDVIESLVALGMARNTAKAQVGAKYKSGDTFDTLFKRVVARANPGAFGRTRMHNPVDAAAALSEKFHGRPAEVVDEYEDELHVHSVLTELGDLIEICVDTESGFNAELDFSKDALKLASSEDGRQLFVQGRVDLDLDALKMGGDKWQRDLMLIGRITALVYRTAKQYDGGKPLEYVHESGEENVNGRHKKTTRVYPVLLYDARNRELQIAGGQQEVQDVGIIR